MKERVGRAEGKEKKAFQKRDVANTEEREVLSLEGCFVGLSWGSSNTDQFDSFSWCVCCRHLKQSCLSHILLGAYLFPLTIGTFLFGLAILILA